MDEPTETARTEPPGNPAVRPTLGAQPLETPADDESPATVYRHVESPARPPRIDGPGIGAPLDDLPPTARRVHGVGRGGSTVTGHGREEAIANAFRHLASGAPFQTSLDPDRPPPPAGRPRSATGAPEAVTGRAIPPSPGAVSRIDRSLPPVVARRIDPATLPASSPAPSVTPPDVVLPLASQRAPLVQGSSPPDPMGDDGLGLPPAAPAPAAPVPVRWAMPAMPGTVMAAAADRGTPTPSAPAGGRSPMMRSPERSVAAPRGAAGSNGAPSGPPPRIRAVGAEPGDPAIDAGPTPSLGGLPAKFDGHPLVQRLRDSRVESPPANGLPSSGQIPPTIPLSYSVQREPEPTRPSRPEAGGPPPARPAPVQRSVDIGEVTAAPEPARAQAEPRGTTEADVDQMFNKLYPRVRDELRWELRVQRERAGLLADPI